MTEEFDFENYNSIYSKVIDERLNRSTDQDVVDKLFSVIESLKKKNSELEGKQYIGRILYNRRLTQKEFDSIYKNNDAFATAIKGKDDTNARSSDGAYMEYFINIPEISGILPPVNLDLLKDWAKNPSKWVEADFEPWFNIIAMYPRFYSYEKDISEAPNGSLIGEYAIVEYPSGVPRPGVGIGKYLELAKSGDG